MITVISYLSLFEIGKIWYESPVTGQDSRKCFDSYFENRYFTILTYYNGQNKRRTKNFMQILFHF
jgi:hypothetical protein